jgi:hypothetical protein
MPYRKKYKRTYRKRNKLADKKINTLVERRMDAIAKKEVQKSLKHFVECKAYPNDAQKQNKTGTRQLVSMNANSTGSMLNSLDSLEYWSITDFGGNYSNRDAFDAGGDDTNRKQSLNFQINKIQAFVTLSKGNSSSGVPTKVTCALIGIPNNNFYTGASAVSSGITTALRPNRGMLTRNNWKLAPTDRDWETPV